MSEHEGMQFVEGHGWLPVVTMTPTEQAEVVVYDRPNPYLIEIGGDSTSPWQAWDEGWDAHAKSLELPAEPEQKLYGLPGSEVLYFDLSTVYENEGWMPFDTDDWEHRESKTLSGYQEPMPPAGFSFVIEEWSVHPASYHLRRADDVLENLAEWVSENGMIDEDASDQWFDTSKDSDLVAAMQYALDLWASKITHRMADRHLCDHVVTFDDNGEPLLDGEPMYVKRPPEDI